MPTPLLPESENERRRQAILEALGAGYDFSGRPGKSAIRYAASRLRMDPGTLRSWYEKDHEDVRIVDSSSTLPAGIYQNPSPYWVNQGPEFPEGEKPRFRVKAGSEHYGQVHTVIAIGDIHDKVSRAKDHLTWIGRFVREQRPDVVVQIGDWASLDSLSTHDAPGSKSDSERATFPQEIDSLDESLDAFAWGVEGFECPHHITLGNHEYRAYKAANLAPKSCDDLPIRLEEAFARRGWKTHEYGRTLDLFGVDFVHIPLSVMGRPLGGQLAENNVARNSIRDTVFGHTHRFGVFKAPRVGHDGSDPLQSGRSITAVNLGTAMPYGVVEKYSGLSLTGWSYGVCVLRIFQGRIISVKHFDMLELKELFG